MVTLMGGSWVLLPSVDDDFWPSLANLRCWLMVSWGESRSELGDISGHPYTTWEKQLLTGLLGEYGVLRCFLWCIETWDWICLLVRNLTLMKGGNGSASQCGRSCRKMRLWKRMHHHCDVLDGKRLWVTLWLSVRRSVRLSEANLCQTLALNDEHRLLL
jgi:hypothetical protein